MIYRVVIPESVYEELNEVALYYEAQQTNLGVKFLNDWENTMERLSKSPFMYQRKIKEFRSALLEHFPYLLIFEAEGSNILIYRLIHAKRSPKKDIYEIEFF